MTSLVNARNGVVEVLQNLFPSGSEFEGTDHAKKYNVEQLQDGKPRGCVFPGGLKTERIARGRFHRRVTTNVLIRARCKSGLEFETVDDFHAFVELVQETIENIVSPIKVTDAQIEIPIDPEEFTEFGIATALLKVETYHE